jgi:hypothetical protein
MGIGAERSAIVGVALKSNDTVGAAWFSGMPDDVGEKSRAAMSLVQNAQRTMSLACDGWESSVT